eukprot:TRINITY_DN9557_c0_g1_i1.p1 TRINITY_DN9557_c0_g1~~TRINITY_DN9557_c0_g1_i1.p1  ORF type:complete len:478 (+),score=108.72 TRINITY_DN9557_c0_g1_i1:201-1634(+)
MMEDAKEDVAQRKLRRRELFRQFYPRDVAVDESVRGSQTAAVDAYRPRGEAWKDERRQSLFQNVYPSDVVNEALQQQKRKEREAYVRTKAAVTVQAWWRMQRFYSVVRHVVARLRRQKVALLVAPEVKGRQADAGSSSASTKRVTLPPSAPQTGVQSWPPSAPETAEQNLPPSVPRTAKQSLPSSAPRTRDQLLPTSAPRTDEQSLPPPPPWPQWGDPLADAGSSSASTKRVTLPPSAPQTGDQSWPPPAAETADHYLPPSVPRTAQQSLPQSARRIREQPLPPFAPQTDEQSLPPPPPWPRWRDPLASQPPQLPIDTPELAVALADVGESTAQVRRWCETFADEEKWLRRLVVLGQEGRNGRRCDNCDLDLLQLQDVLSGLREVCLAVYEDCFVEERVAARRRNVNRHWAGPAGDDVPKVLVLDIRSGGYGERVEEDVLNGRGVLARVMRALRTVEHADARAKKLATELQVATAVP